MINKNQNKVITDKLILFFISSVFIVFIVLFIFIGISGCVLEPNDDLIFYQQTVTDEGCFL